MFDFNRLPNASASSLTPWRIGFYGIGSRLMACFAAILGLMIVSALLNERQQQAIHAYRDRIEMANHMVISVLHVNNSVLLFKNTAQDAVANENLDQLRAVIGPFERSFVREVDDALSALRQAPDVSRNRSNAISFLTYYRTILPDELEALTKLAAVNDWPAVRLRIKNQVSNRSDVLSQIASQLDKQSQLSRDQSLAQAAALQKRTFIIWLVSCSSVILVAFLLALLVTRSIVRPLKALETGAITLARGSLNHRIEVEGQDELSLLADAFNKAAEAIEESHALLESRVAERTSQLEHAVQEAQKASRVKGEFLANMSHEIRTPMNGILGMTELALLSDLTPQQREYLEAVKYSGEALLAIVNDILDFSRIEAGKLTVEPTPCELRRALQEISWPLSTEARRKGLTFRLFVADEVPDHVMIDRLRLSQVLINLLGNAVKFTARGAIELRVRLAQNVTGAQANIAFSVADSGIGIAPEKLATIFDAFTQADSSVTRVYGGTGLGLAISSRLVSLMGGEMDVKSEPSKGSCFCFTLACQVVAPLIAQLPLTDPQAAPAESPTASLNVLLVDDNAINRKVASSMIERLGHRVVCAEDGQAAVDAFLTATFDLVFMDIQMPHMGGLEATQHIRHSEALRGLAATPIVALTAHAMKGDQERCIEAGMNDYLSKPVRPQELRAKLLKWTAATPVQV